MSSLCRVIEAAVAVGRLQKEKECREQATESDLDHEEQVWILKSQLADAKEEITELTHG